MVHGECTLWYKQTLQSSEYKKNDKMSATVFGMPVSGAISHLPCSSLPNVCMTVVRLCTEDELYGEPPHFLSLPSSLGSGGLSWYSLGRYDSPVPTCSQGDMASKLRKACESCKGSVTTRLRSSS